MKIPIYWFLCWFGTYSTIYKIIPLLLRVNLYDSREHFTPAQQQLSFTLRGFQHVCVKLETTGFQMIVNLQVSGIWLFVHTLHHQFISDLLHLLQH